MSPPYKTRTRKNNPKERESDKRPIRFNGEVSFGTLLSMGAMLLSLYGFYTSSTRQINDAANKVDTRLAVVETKVDAMWNSFKFLTGAKGD